MTERIYTAGLVVIGDEILSGRTHDKNIAQIASWLQVQGIRLSEVRVIPDVLEAPGAPDNVVVATEVLGGGLHGLEESTHEGLVGPIYGAISGNDLQGPLLVYTHEGI